MANISAYLQAIMQAVYGEEVRGSIHDAIDIINKVGEKTITLGTAVTASSSSRTGYYDSSLYLNTNTWDLWKCGSSAWNLEGNLKGGSIGSITKTGTSGLVDTYSVSLESGQSVGTFTVTNGERVNGSKSGNTVTITTTHADGTTSSVSLKDGAKIGVGTGVTATNTSATVDGVVYYSGDIYINNSTWHVWQRGASSWTDEGSIIGPRGYSFRYYDYDGTRLPDIGRGLDAPIYPKTKPENGIQNGDILLSCIDLSNGDVGIIFWEVTDLHSSQLTNDMLLICRYTFTIPKGDTGSQGTSISSVNLVSKSDRVSTYQVNLDNNTSAGTFEVFDGETGATGATGAPGFSPTVTTSKVGKVTTVTIVDQQGTHTFEVRDGDDGAGTGDMLKSTYDQDNDGIVDLAMNVVNMPDSSTLSKKNMVLTKVATICENEAFGEDSREITFAEPITLTAGDYYKIEYEMQSSNPNSYPVRSGSGIGKCETKDGNVVCVFFDNYGTVAYNKNRYILLKTTGIEDYWRTNATYQTAIVSIYKVTVEWEYDQVEANAKGIDNVITGYMAEAEGAGNKAIGSYSHAEGKDVKALGSISHAEGVNTEAVGLTTHAEGDSTYASGESSHAEGNNTRAEGDRSHAEGSNTNATVDSAHAEGHTTTASGNYSHSEGDQTTAYGESSHVEGYKCYISSTGTYAHAEGNSSQSNGNASHAEGTQTRALNTSAHSEGQYSYASGGTSHAEGGRSHAYGTYSHVEGGYNIAVGIGSHAEGDGSQNGYPCTITGAANALQYDLVFDDQNPAVDVPDLTVGAQLFISSLLSNSYITEIVSASGMNATVKVNKTIATSAQTNKAGFVVFGTYAGGTASHAEGTGTRATGTGTHAEGSITQANGQFTHAEGFWTKAAGIASHAGGYATIAGYSYQTAIGKCNSNNSSNLLEVGNGTESSRSNAFEVRSNGDAKVAGELYLGSTSLTSKINAAIDAKLADVVNASY